MLRIQNPRTMQAQGVAETEYPLHVEDDAWYIDHKYDGMDELHFELNRGEDYEGLIQAEAMIITARNNYLIKNIDARGDYLVVDCQIDVDDWRGPFWHNFRQTDISVSEAVNMIKPTGWTVQMVDTYTKRRTIEASDGQPMVDVTAFDILMRICSLWGCVVNFDNKNKTVKVIDPEHDDESGVYLSEETNLTKKVEYTANSAGFATRLYPYGAKDETTGLNLTIASVNGGLEYIENHESQLDKVISIGWTDERFTVAENLLEAARAKLAEYSSPVVSYNLQLREVDTRLKMYSTAAFVGSQVQHRVVEYREYPDRPDLDSVTLSAVMPSISTDVYDALTARVSTVEDKVEAIEISPPWTASETELGAVMVGDGLTADTDGKLNINVGDGLEIGDDGSLNVTGGGGSSWDGKIGGTNNAYGTIKQYTTNTAVGATWDNSGITFNNTGITFNAGAFIRFLNGTVELIKMLYNSFVCNVGAVFGYQKTASGTTTTYTQAEIGTATPGSQSKRRPFWCGFGQLFNAIDTDVVKYSGGNGGICLTSIGDDCIEIEDQCYDDSDGGTGHHFCEADGGSYHRTMALRHVSNTRGIEFDAGDRTYKLTIDNNGQVKVTTTMW